MSRSLLFPQKEVDSNILEFCNIGPPKTLGEKEADFLMALQAFYDGGEFALAPARGGRGRLALLRVQFGASAVAGADDRMPPSRSTWARVVGGEHHTWLSPPLSAAKPIMSNEEFDVLKQELLWEGSKVAVLTTSEQVRFPSFSTEIQNTVARLPLTAAPTPAAFR